MEEKYTEIDLIELFKIVLRKWWLLLSLFFVGFFIAYYYTTHYITPVYQANSTLFIGKETDEIAGIGISMSELQISYQLINDYEQIIRTRLVADEVIKNSGLNMSVGAFIGSISIATIGDSRLFTVSFRNPDPKVAADVANDLSTQLSIAVSEIVGVENIRIIDKALVPSYPIGPNVRMNSLIAGIIGLFLGLFFILVQKLMNNTIQKEEDVENIFGLTVLAVIPKFKGEARK